MKKITHLDEIAALFSPGASLVMHSACAAPPRLSAQLLDLAAARGPFALFDLSSMAEPRYAPGIASGTLRLTTFVPVRSVRGPLQAGLVDVIRRPLSEAPLLFQEGAVRPDVLFLHLSTPDADGLMSLGISCDTMPAVLARRPTVVAEINPDMPRTHGETGVTAGQVDYWIEGGGTPGILAPARGDAKDDAIADRIAGLIDHGDVIQAGIGSIPDLALQRLTHLANLGMHTGILTDAAWSLLASGAVTNALKPDMPGKTLATMAAGSASFYRFLHDNRDIVFQPCDRTHDRERLARLPRLCAINAALEIDLSGRINAEIADGRRVSGPGGQFDFARGAHASPGGKSIVALRATSKEGLASRIVRALPPEVAPTIDTNVVDYVVTEHGVARVTGLRGASLAEALVGIAAPEFRKEL